MHQVLYNTSESGQFGAFIWRAAHEVFGCINHSSPQQFSWHHVRMQSSPWTQILLLYYPDYLNHGDYYAGKVVSFIPNCMGVNGTSMQICCVTSASSSLGILLIFFFFLPILFHLTGEHWKQNHKIQLILDLFLAKRGLNQKWNKRRAESQPGPPAFILNSLWPLLLSYHFLQITYQTPFYVSTDLLLLFVKEKAHWCREHFSPLAR